MSVLIKHSGISEPHLSLALPNPMSESEGWPRITIVTPSFNQGQYLEETIESVLGQGYKNLEYIIMDGGSSDNSVQIIKKYERHLAYWTSAPDGGQSAAINAGFQKGSGDILCWLNSDDMYLPNALKYVAQRLNPTSSEIVFGNCLHLVESGAGSYGSDVFTRHHDTDIKLRDYIVQPSSFWTKKAWEEVGVLDETLTYAFDWDWFIRAKMASVIFKPDTKSLSVYRIHDAHKSGTGGSKRLMELAHIYRKYSGPAFANLFLKSQARRRQIQQARKWIARLRLTRWEYYLLTILLPDLKTLGRDQGYSVLSME